MNIINEVNDNIARAKSQGLEVGSVSDGYHTFDELYEHRITLYIALCRLIVQSARKLRLTDFHASSTPVWRSKAHSDGSVWEGWFILGIGVEAGKQITYHLPESKWKETEFAKTIEKAPEWDQHTPADVLLRLAALGA